MIVMLAVLSAPAFNSTRLPRSSANSFTLSLSYRTQSQCMDATVA